MTEDKARTLTTLLWGVKQSFCNYVEGAGGAIETLAGAGRLEGGGFSFAAAPGGGLVLDSAGRPQGGGVFLGEVRFAAHGGMLSVILADPIVEITGAEAVLTVADSSARTRRVEVARLDLAAMTSPEPGEVVIPAALSMDGGQWLGDHYPMRTPLDPVRLTAAKP